MVDGCVACHTLHGDTVALLARLDSWAEAHQITGYDGPPPRLPETRQEAHRWAPVLVFAALAACIFGAALWWSGGGRKLATNKRTWRYGLTMSPSLPSGWERPTLSVSMHNVARVLSSNPYSGHIKFPNRPARHGAADIGPDVVGMSISLRHGDLQNNQQTERNNPS